MATSLGDRLEAKAKHYILAAFTAGFITAAVVTIVTVVLSPAHLSFSVTDARYKFTSDDEGRGQLFLTLVVQNPSRRAAVRYQSIFVDVANSTTPTYNWIMRADVSVVLPLYQRRRSNTSVSATVSMKGLAGADQFTAHRTSGNFSVMVTAVARFRVGVAWTRLYDINVYCGNVDFFGNASRISDCQPAA